MVSSKVQSPDKEGRGSVCLLTRLRERKEIARTSGAHKSGVTGGDGGNYLLVSGSTEPARFSCTCADGFTMSCVETCARCGEDTFFFFIEGADEISGVVAAKGQRACLAACMFDGQSAGLLVGWLVCVSNFKVDSSCDKCSWPATTSSRLGEETQLGSFKEARLRASTSASVLCMRTERAAKPTLTMHTIDLRLCPFTAGRIRFGMLRRAVQPVSSLDMLQPNCIVTTVHHV